MIPSPPLLEPWLSSLGSALLHFVWQGTLCAALFYLSLFLVRRAKVRYTLGCLALALMAAAPLGTLFYLADRPNPASVVTSSSAPTLEDAPMAGEVEDSIIGMPLMSLKMPGQAFETGGRTTRSLALLPYLVSLWALGVALLSLRLLGGWWISQRWRRGRCFAPAEVQRTLFNLMERLHLRRPVRLFVSSYVAAPVTLGMLKPVILLPASALTGLSCAQLELILAHELSHIRRHDYLVNLLQRVVETLLFYHPAVWWVSSIVRQERECCCDDAVLRLGGERWLYAEALSKLERQRVSPSLALSANDGALLRRVKRLLGLPTAQTPAVGWAALFTLSTTILTAFALSFITPAEAQVEDTPPAAASPAANRQLWIDIEGDVAFSEDYAWVEAISKGGSITLEAREDNKPYRFLNITPSEGSLRYSFAEGEPLELVWEGNRVSIENADFLHVADLSTFAERTPVGAEWLHASLQSTVSEISERRSKPGVSPPEGPVIQHASHGYLADGTFYSVLWYSETPEALEFHYQRPETGDVAADLDVAIRQATQVKAHGFASDESVQRVVLDILNNHLIYLTPASSEQLLYLSEAVNDDRVKADILTALAAKLPGGEQLQDTFIAVVETIADETLQEQVLKLLDERQAVPTVPESESSTSPRTIWATVSSGIAFEEGFTGIEGLSSLPGKDPQFILLEERTGGENRSVRVTPGQRFGDLNYEYRVNGQPQAFDEAARAWYETALELAILKPFRNHYQKNPAVGFGGGAFYTDNAFVSLLIAEEDRTRDTILLMLASPLNEAISPSQLGQVRHTLAHGLLSEKSVSSLLLRVMTEHELTPDKQSEIIRIIGEITEDQLKAELLEGLAMNQAPLESDVEALFREVANTVADEGRRRRVLELLDSGADIERQMALAEAQGRLATLMEVLYATEQQLAALSHLVETSATILSNANEEEREQAEAKLKALQAALAALLQRREALVEQIEAITAQVQALESSPIYIHPYADRFTCGNDLVPEWWSETCEGPGLEVRPRDDNFGKGLINSP